VRTGIPAGVLFDHCIGDALQVYVLPIDQGEIELMIPLQQPRESTRFVRRTASRMSETVTPAAKVSKDRV